MRILIEMSNKKFRKVMYFTKFFVRKKNSSFRPDAGCSSFIFTNLYDSQFVSWLKLTAAFYLTAESQTVRK